MPEIVLERGLPCNLDAERFILGAVLQDDTRFLAVAASLNADDFSLEKHRRIYSRMLELHERSERIDRVTVANELMAHRQLESCGGIGYLASLDEGLPELVHFESYVSIVREKSRLRQLIFTSQSLIDRALMDDGTQANELAKATSERLIQIGTSDKENKLAQVGEIIRGPDGGLDRFLSHSVNQSGIQTGFSRLDQMTGGLQRGDLIVIAGRPSMGKTAFALNLAHHAATAKQQVSVALFSLEMSRASLITRMLCSAGHVDFAKQRAGYLNTDEKTRLRLAADKLAKARLFIDDGPANTIMDIGAKLRRLRADQGVDLCVIDYLGLIPAHRKTDNRVRELGEITRYLKLMVAKELHIPVVLLSQLSRAPEIRPGDHRPMLSDLRESGDIEQDADVVALIYREEIYKPNEEALRGLAELIVAKQRNGPTGCINLLFRREFTLFEDRTQGYDL